jgi:pimeloyl-ACP methyl ester carboxylesterase
VPIHFTALGKGEPALIFVHGWTLNGTFWEQQLGHFAATYQVVAVDLAGHGESGVGRDHWTMEAFGGDVAAVVDELNLDRVVLIGHSMGGAVVLEAARRLGGRVAGLVFVDSFFDPDNESPEEEEKEIVELFRADFRGNVGSTSKQYFFTADADSLLKERIANHMSSFDPNIGVAAITELFAYEDWEVIGEMDVPMAAINANMYPTNVERLYDYGVEPYIMEGVGHFLMMERPEEFNRILEEAIQERD